MVMSFLNRMLSAPAGRRPRPRLMLGLAILILACGLAAACSSSPPSASQTTSSSQATATSGSGSTATNSGTATSSTATSGGALACASLSPLLPVLQAGKLHVTFEMAAGSAVALKGSVTSFQDVGGLTMKGQGYLVSPNDPIQIQITQGSSSVQIMVKDTKTGQVTTYNATACSAKTSSDIELTGTDPTSFTLDILITP